MQSADKKPVLLDRTKAFCERYALELPVLEAPMAGACPPDLAAAVSRAGGMGALGALTTAPKAIGEWVQRFRDLGGTALQINLWVPDPEPARDAVHESAVARFLERWGPAVPDSAGDARPFDFRAQLDAVIAARPSVASSIMGLFAPDEIAALKAEGIAYFATVTTVAEARAAEAAGADAIIVQGMEAGGHRGAFDARAAERDLVGLFALLPRIADVVHVPLVAAGAIGDGRTIAAALTLGASAVVIGSALLQCAESSIAPAWKAALASLEPEDTMLTRAFSGRAGRAIANDYARAAAAPDAPAPAPYPVQRGLTAAMREDAVARDDITRMQAWAGQGAAFGRRESAADFVRRVWAEALS